MWMMVLLLLSWFFVVPVAAQEPPTDPDHAKIVDAIVPEVEGVHKYVGQVNAEVKKALTKLETLTTQLSTLATQVGTLNTTVAAIKTSVATLTTEVAAVKSAVATVEADVATVDGKIVALDTKVSGIETDILDLPIEIAAEARGPQLLTMSVDYVRHGRHHVGSPRAATFVPDQFAYDGYRDLHLQLLLTSGGVDALAEFTTATVGGISEFYGASYRPPNNHPFRADAVHVPFPAGTIDEFSFMVLGKDMTSANAPKACDMTIAVWVDGVATNLSQSITDYDYDVDAGHLYTDPDAVDINTGSTISIGITSTDDCSSSAEPEDLFLSMNFTPATD